MKNPFSYRTRLILSHTCVIVTFIIGMLLNFFLIFPVIDNEIGFRINNELDRYFDYFSYHEGDIRDGEKTLEELFNTQNNFKYADGRPNSEYFNGELFVLSTDKKILFNNVGLSGNADSIFVNRYGHIPQEDIENEKLNNSDWHGTIVYHLDHELYETFIPGCCPYNAYIRYEKQSGFIYYYFFQIRELYDTASARYYTLLYIFIIGIIIIFFVSLESIKKITRSYINEKKSQHVLETASAIQLSMLPKYMTQYLNADITAYIKPALKIGGDLYYYTHLNGYLYFCIGDVSGKGIPPALFMSRAVSLFKAFVQSEFGTDKIVEKMNNDLSEHNECNYFLTAFVGKLRLSDGYLEYCNAGHEPPLFWDGNTDHEAVYLKNEGGVPIGFDSSSNYESGSMTMPTNSLLFLYTDGITEAKNSKTGLYGKKRLLEKINEIKGYKTQTIKDKIIESVSEFTADNEQFDDITLLAIRKFNQDKTITIKNSIRSLQEFAKYCNYTLNEFTLDNKEKIRIRAGLDEAVTNCVLYAYGKEKGLIEIWTSYDNGKLIFRITDQGIEFNPLTYEKPESDEICIGGLGIEMFKEIFDELKYERIDGKNILYLIKKMQ